SVTPLPPPSGDSTFTPTAISDSGLVAGQASTGGSNLAYQAARYSNGQTTGLGSPSGGSTNLGMEPISINDSGQIVAVGPNASGTTNTDLLLYSNGHWTDLTALATGSSFHIQNIHGPSIDNAGDVVAQDAHTGDTLLYHNGQWTDIGQPSAGMQS